MNKELRILQYVRVLDNGGIERLIFNILENTDRTLVNYDFLLTRNQQESHETDLMKYHSKKVIVQLKTDSNLILKYYNTYRQLYNYFCGCPYKIVHFQSVGTSFGGSLAIIAAKRAGIPIRIIHAHSANSKKKIIKSIDVLIGQYLHRRYGTHFLACSKKAAEFSFGKNFSKKCKVDILKNGINTQSFRFSIIDRDEIRNELNIKNNFVIGTIGRLSPEKNHLFMLDILREILKVKKNAVLVIVGSTSAGHEDYENMIKSKIRDSDIKEHVIFAGERRDAYRLYSAFDAYLFPSLWEGLGIAAIEAQTNGLPVFAATTVPEETCITSNYYSIDLNKSAKYWSDIICSKSNRVDEYDKIISAGYDISNSANFMTEYYLKLNEEV